MNEIIKRPHAGIVHIPITLYPVSLIFMAIFWYSDNSAFLFSSFWCFMFAAIAIVPVSITGLLDMIRLKSQPDEGHRLLKIHLISGIVITLVSLVAGVYFYQNPPMDNTNMLIPFAAILGLLSFMVMAQGLIGAIMVYQHHIGIDGETR